MMGFSNRVWKGVKKEKRGRKEGFIILTDARIPELMEPYLSVSSRRSRRTGRPLRTLNMSKKRLFMQLPEVHKHITLGTLAKQRQRGRLGVGIWVQASGRVRLLRVVRRHPRERNRSFVAEDACVD